MNRIAIAITLFGFGVAFLVVGNLVNHAPSGTPRMTLWSLAAGVLISMMGAFILIKREALVKGYVADYEHFPSGIRNAYSLWWQRFWHFKTYEAFTMFNTVLVGSGCLTIGLICLAFFAYHVVSGQ
jgi:hypothetical protein